MTEVSGASPVSPEAGRAVVMEASDLQIEYRGGFGRVRALDGATLRVQRGDVVALVGESGSGKTTLGMAAGRLLAANASRVGGWLKVRDTDVFSASPAAIRELRRQALGFVFQNPVASLDPTTRIHRQMTDCTPTGTEVDAEGRLSDVGLSDIPRVLRSFPHELSGGMAQRVCIAMAMIARPDVLVADEPTAAVDAVLRGRILELLVEQVRARQCSLLLLTHNLPEAQRFATHVAVMYAGRVVEYGTASDVLASPLHPYTQALLTALPGEERAGQRLHAIQGSPPVLSGPSSGCGFAARCPQVFDPCWESRPVYDVVDAGHAVCCHRARSPLASAPRAEVSRAADREEDLP